MVIFYSYVTVYQRVYQMMYNNNLNHLTYGDDHDENSRRIPQKTNPTGSCLDFRSCVQGSWILMINGCWWDRNAISCIIPALLSPKKTLFICIAPFGETRRLTRQWRVSRPSHLWGDDSRASKAGNLAERPTGGSPQERKLVEQTSPRTVILPFLSGLKKQPNRRKYRWKVGNDNEMMGKTTWNYPLVN